MIIITVLVISILSCSSGPKPSISSTDPDLRYRALLDLDYSGKLNQHLDLVTELVTDDRDPLVRALCASYLSKYKYTTGVPVLLKALQDQDALVRESAVKAFGLMAGKEAVKPLLGLLADDKSNQVRRAVAQVLGDMGKTDALEGLIARLDDVDSSVSYAALKALRKITGQSLGRDADAWEKCLKEQPPKETK